MTSTGVIDIGISLYSVVLALIVATLKMKGNQLISNFSILIGLLGAGLVMSYCLVMMGRV